MIGAGMESSVESVEQSSTGTADRSALTRLRSAANWAAGPFRQFRQNILARLIMWSEKRIPAHSAVGTGPLIPNEEFPWAETLARGWPDIRGELDELIAHYEALPNIQDIATDQSGLTQDDRWKSFFFLVFGDKFEGNCQRCPKTAALLADIPGVTTAFFSILGPHKYLRPHRGYYRGIVRYHLAMKVPGDGTACGIRVGDEEVHWSEGAGFFFDDTYRHEAWNKTPELRVVLILDLVRPLSFPHSALNKAIIYGMARSAGIRNAKVRHEAWERSFEKLLSGK
jgi:ornithine lipid ester-linked acyl 2-hydroxylase